MNRWNETKSKKVKRNVTKAKSYFIYIFYYREWNHFYFSVKFTGTNIHVTNYNIKYPSPDYLISVLHHLPEVLSGGCFDQWILLNETKLETKL